ncbi:uncharacterized protein LOC127536384 [Acanthochromis polyacanthus]|uniref:uncharacterized protein LOC127536384 n=1 Tax=Acanthochromis polyacanthus TaxID=80966 RepID=UPI0022349C60|nr:uncharacterized protein LOC127536384 [Acanthochromis polyacanthus]
MLFTLGLLLLLTPFPSFQTTTSEKRDTTGSDVTKPNAVFTLSKPKTTAAPAKQTVHSTLKPNTVNQTVLPTLGTNQKPPTVGATAKAFSGTITNKEKHIVSVNQTVLAKSPSASEVKTSKDKPAHTGAAQSASTKSASASGAKTTKDKLQPSVNQTVSIKSPSTSNGKAAKDKPAPTVVQNVQSTSNQPAPTSDTKTTKNKPTASVNQTVVAKSPATSEVKSKDRPAFTKVQTVLPTKAATVADKDKVTASANQTTSIKAPSTTTKENPVPSQPIKVIISDGCDSSNAKGQELKLKPGAPLVMTHKISLVPGGCTGGCEAEMAALKGRVARLEKEMSSLKEKCPCSANCPNDCSGNGDCEKGKCVCQQGFTGVDCKATKGKVMVTVETVTLQVNQDKENAQERTTKAEHTLFQKKEKKGKTDAGKTGKGKFTRKSQSIVNTTIVATSDEANKNKTATHGSGKSTRRNGGTGLGSVKVVNISSYSFTLTWSAPQGMFKNFTVIRREPRTEGDEDEHEKFEEEVLEGDKISAAKNTTEVLVQSESTNMTTKGVGSRGRAETKRISMVVPGNVRSMEFSNLRANTRYVLHIYGTTAERRSKIHRVTAITGNLQ